MDGDFQNMRGFQLLEAPYSHFSNYFTLLFIFIQNSGGFTKILSEFESIYV